MSINIFKTKNSKFELLKLITVFSLLIIFVIPTSVIAVNEPINYEIIPGTNSIESKNNSYPTGTYYADRVRPLSFYGLNSYEIQTHGASSVFDQNNPLGVSHSNTVGTSISTINASPSSNSITPGGTSNQNINIAQSNTNTSFNPNNSVPISAGSVSKNNVSIEIPSVDNGSYLNNYYNVSNYSNLSYGNNNTENNSYDNTSYENNSIDNSEDIPTVMFANENYGSDETNNSSENDSIGLLSYINDSYVPGNYTGTVYRSGSYSNGSKMSASVFNGAYNPKTQVATVVEAPKEEVPVKKVAPCEPYLKTYLGCGFGDDKNEVIKLQKFLRDYEGYDIKVTGLYDNTTFETVRKFQERYALDVLKESWGLNCSTGCVYITTKAKINDIVCQKTTNYKNIELPNPRPKFTCPDEKDVKSGKVKVTTEIAKNCSYINS